MERIFSRRWLYVGRASALGGAGAYRLCEIGDESVIVLQNREGEFRAFFNVCRHRGARLCAEPGGVLKKTIRCPYHAWTYSLDGKLIGAPNMADEESFDEADWPLRPVAITVWEGGIFLNLAEDPPPFEHEFAPLFDKFPEWKLGELEAAHRIVYDIAANWKLVFRNYSECYHCPSLHPVANRLTPYGNASNDLEEGPILGGPMRMAQDGGSMTMSGARCAAPLGEVSGENLNLVHYYTVFPNLLLSFHPDYVLVQEIRPRGADRTQIACEWLFHPDEMAKPDFDPSPAVEFWNMTNEQDWEVSEQVQKGVASRSYTPGPYAELESMVAAWDREYLRVMER
jgi:Rieske 2Fe-2S family protein